MNKVGCLIWNDEVCVDEIFEAILVRNTNHFDEDVNDFADRVERKLDSIERKLDKIILWIFICFL